MTNHVRVSEIQNDQIIICHSRANFVSNLQGAHLRLQVVSRDLGRRYNHAVFTWKRALNSAVKEIGDVRIFFRFGNAQLSFTGGADDFPEDIGEVSRRKNVGRRIGHIVLSKGYKVNSRPPSAIEAIEILEQKRLRKLTRAVCAKIKEQDDVVIVHAFFSGI